MTAPEPPAEQEAGYAPPPPSGAGSSSGAAPQGKARAVPGKVAERAGGSRAGSVAESHQRPARTAGEGTEVREVPADGAGDAPEATTGGGEMNGLTAVSLFAGVGGFDEALRRTGAHVAAAVEIDPECRGVLARHFPRTALFDDVRKVTGDQIRAAGFVPERGIMAGGWPCQDLSIAGRRSGLGGARSGLFWEVVRLAAELRPRWLLLENVDDLLSSACPCPGDGTCVGNGRSVRCGKLFRDQWQPGVQHNPPGGACRGGCMDVHGGAMGAVVGALEQLGYGLCWRVLDAQYAGVPQRRQRLFFVGCLGDGAAPVEVLLEPESSEGDFAARSETRPGRFPRRSWRRWRRWRSRLHHPGRRTARVPDRRRGCRRRPPGRGAFRAPWAGRRQPR